MYMQVVIPPHLREINQSRANGVLYGVKGRNHRLFTLQHPVLEAFWYRSFLLPFIV